MIVLAIETASGLVGTAVVGDGRVLAESIEVGGRRHAEALAPSLDRTRREAGVELRDLDAIAVDVGPGLFTGLRVGVAAAQALGFALGRSLVAVTSVEALAAAVAPGLAPGSEIQAVVDARRGEVFTARYRAGPPDASFTGRLSEMSPPMRCTPEALARALGEEGGAVTLVGDGAHRYEGVLGAASGVRIAGCPQDPLTLFARPGVVAGIALQQIEAGVAPLEPARVAPIYLRDAEVRINWEQRHPRSVPRPGRAGGDG